MGFIRFFVLLDQPEGCELCDYFLTSFNIQSFFVHKIYRLSQTKQEKAQRLLEISPSNPLFVILVFVLVLVHTFSRVDFEIDVKEWGFADVGGEGDLREEKQGA